MLRGYRNPEPDADRRELSDRRRDGHPAFTGIRPGCLSAALQPGPAGKIIQFN